MSAPGRHGPRRGPYRALGEYRCAPHEGALMSALPGRPKEGPLPLGATVRSARVHR